MQAGQLRQFITITSAPMAQDSFGQPIAAGGDPTPVLTTWSCITAANGKDIYRLGVGFTSQVTHKIVIRFPTGVAIAAGMTAQYQGRTFLIQATSDPNELQRELDLLCLEQTK